MYDPFDFIDEGFLIADDEGEERRRKEMEDEFYDFGEPDSEWEWEVDDDEW